MGGLPDAARDTGLLIEGFPQTINFQNSPGEAVDDRGSGGAMLTNTIEIGTARLTTRRVTLTARTAVSPRATPNSPAGPGTPSAPARRPSRFPALACVLALAVLATPALAQTDATNTSTVPGPPTGLLAAAGHGGRSDLSWTAPASDGGDPLSGYKIEVSSDTGASWTDRVATTGDANTTYSHTGLAAATTRHYRVSAINTNGTGDASNVANATTFTTIPSAPTKLLATAGGTTQIDLSWTAPADDGGSAIITYGIHVSPDGRTDWRARAGNPNTTYSQIGLAPGTTRYYRVRAANAKGLSALSNIASATTGQATVTFGASVYTAVEGGAAATVEVQLSAALSAPVTIPLEVTLQGGATAADYSGIPETVTFGADQTAVTFTVIATADTDAETGERVSIGFGTLPEGVFARSPATATVTLADRSGPGPGPTTDPDPTAPPPPPDPEPDPEPEPLEVAIVGVPDVAVAGESYELTAQSDEESLVYEWSVAGGTIEPDDAQMVVWTAPETASVAWIRVDVTREDGATAGRSDYVRVEVPEPEPEPVPALPLIGQLLLGVGLLGGGARRLYRRRRQTAVYDTC